MPRTTDECLHTERAIISHSRGVRHRWGHRSRGNPLIDLVRNATTGPEGSPRQLNYLRKAGEHPMSVNVLYQTSTRATAGRDGHGCRIYPQQMRGSSLELRGDSRNVRNCCICVVALSRTT